MTYRLWRSAEGIAVEKEGAWLVFSREEADQLGLVTRLSRAVENGSPRPLARRSLRPSNFRQNEFGDFGYLAPFRSGRCIALLSRNFLFLAKASGSIATILADIITGHRLSDPVEH